MTLPEPNLWSWMLEHFGVTVCAVAGTLADRGRQVDLFGVLVLALVTAWGRRRPFAMCVWGGAGVLDSGPVPCGHGDRRRSGHFSPGPWRRAPMNLLETAEAFGPAWFIMVGACESLGCESGMVAGVALGTITGGGGRDRAGRPAERNAAGLPKGNPFVSHCGSVGSRRVRGR